MAVEALNLQLDNLKREVQALRVENVKLREANPEISSLISVGQSEMEELRQSLHEARECEIRVQQEKEALQAQLVDVNSRLEGAELARSNEQRAKEEVQDSLTRAEIEITELRRTTGRLQLELKCALNEKELCDYRLREAQSMTRMPSSVVHAAREDEASSRSDIVSSASPSAIAPAGAGRHLERVDSPARTRHMEPSTVLTPTATGVSVSPERTDGPTPIIHPSQAPPITKYGGNSDSETFEEWCEQFELVAAACGWNEKLKLANLATRLHGQAYAFYRTCTSQQRSTYSELVAALKKRFTPVRIQSVQSELFHSRKQQAQEKVDEYAQDLSRLYQKAYPQARQGTGETEVMGKTVLAYQFVAGLLPNIRAKVAGTEGTFEQLWVKARYEEAKFRDLDPRSNSRNPNTRGTTVMRQDAQTPPRNQPNPVGMARKCWVCHQVGHVAKACPQQRRGQPVEAPSRQQNNRNTTSCVTGKTIFD